MKLCVHTYIPYILKEKHGLNNKGSYTMSVTTETKDYIDLKYHGFCVDKFMIEA